MSSQSNTIAAPSAPTSTTRKLWVTVGVLSVALAALGGVMLGAQLPGSVSPDEATLQSRLDAPSTQRVATSVPPVVSPVRKPVAAPRAEPWPAAPQAVVCTDCGTVLSVSEVRRDGATNGTGAVAGGVVGAVVGNQVGGGSGRAVATVLGALGGGWAGNSVEKRVKQTTAYVVKVRMDDGRVRSLEQAQPLTVGSPVVVQGGVARVADAAHRPVVVRG